MDRSSDGIAIGLRADQAETYAAISGKLVVPVQVGNAIVCGEQQVEISVAIEVPIRKPASYLGLVEASAEFASDVVKLLRPSLRNKSGD